MGKLIVFYGINNLGKSTQAKLLVEKLTSEGKKAIYLKYPVYDIKPSGVVLNDYLRKGNPFNLTPKEAQIIYAFNRAQYEPSLREILQSDAIVVSEDYWGTGVAWGAGAGVDFNFLLELNKHFIREDLALLFQGKRFVKGIEKNHLYEQDNALTERVREVHEKLADQFNWQRIDASQSIEQVFENIWNQVAKIL